MHHIASVDSCFLLGYIPLDLILLLQLRLDLGSATGGESSVLLSVVYGFPSRWQVFIAQYYGSSCRSSSSNTVEVFFRQRAGRVGHTPNGRKTTHDDRRYCIVIRVVDKSLLFGRLREMSSEKFRNEERKKMSNYERREMYRMLRFLRVLVQQIRTTLRML